jgi:hypothetical protein
MSTSTPRKNPNSGLLEGFACPECGSFGPFKIEHSKLVMVYDHELGDEEDLGFHDEGLCVCEACGFSSNVAHFTSGKEGA